MKDKKLAWRRVSRTEFWAERLLCAVDLIRKFVYWGWKTKRKAEKSEEEAGSGGDKQGSTPKAFQVFGFYVIL